MMASTRKVKMPHNDDEDATGTFSNTYLVAINDLGENVTKCIDRGVLPLLDKEYYCTSAGRKTTKL